MKSGAEHEKGFNFACLLRSSRKSVVIAKNVENPHTIGSHTVFAAVSQASVQYTKYRPLL
jgi:hypothetical protein